MQGAGRAGLKVTIAGFVGSATVCYLLAPNFGIMSELIYVQMRFYAKAVI